MVIAELKFDGLEIVAKERRPEMRLHGKECDPRSAGKERGYPLLAGGKDRRGEEAEHRCLKAGGGEHCDVKPRPFSVTPASQSSEEDEAVKDESDVSAEENVVEQQAGEEECKWRQ